MGIFNFLLEDDISQDSDCFSGLSNYKPVKRWRYVRLEKTCQCNEQVALLLKVLKCDKSVIPSIYEFRSLCCFHAYLTLDEAENLSELEEVEVIDFPSMSEVARKAKRTRSRTSNGLLKAKKQKTSMAGSIISQRRQNKEKLRYNEGMPHLNFNYLDVLCISHSTRGVIRFIANVLESLQIFGHFCML
ncbi:uncharacterized protein [Gossypium hirsutum]|uniref:Uncharacterized protein isoform X10 n=1 Tax=Gossypium hirsutum TaxID=3635 RepID=A0A1U8MSW6_GOSHI|nr:uncharacterized protein LOC107940696 isoform X10 [Gossypium hirsutum]XP_040965549.1 uncharacterized protein LOC107940696 isoform X10 [Gossypium hirsutum]